MTVKLKITECNGGYESRYPQILKRVETQLEVNYWTPKETKVESDNLELKYTISEKARNSIKMMLPMFLRYELNVSEFWTEVYPKFFKAPECLDAAAAINMIERCVHARFYDKVNKVYGLDNDKSYLSYADDPVFKARAKWIGDLLKSDDLKLVCLIFGLIEAAGLFSLFALLRSFQANGHNEIPVVVKGTKQSAVDERLHSMVLSDSFRIYYNELGMTINEDVYYLNLLNEAAQVMYGHEEHIIDSLIPDGEDGYNGITRFEYKTFIKRRIDEYFERLGVVITPFGVKESKLDELFDIQNEAYSEPDFFTKGVNKEYEASWDEEAFTECWEV